ncbi:hypothetical protein TNCV_3968611 [Trichonephila clavipes]|nr:hypothetical protein TNCV_3968611 [Trichonephila clavipes]
MFGRRIAARQPPPTCLPELRNPLLDEWCNIPQDQIDNLVLIMLRRYDPFFIPELAPLDCHLYRSLRNFFNGKNFSVNDDLKWYLVEFFADKEQKIYEHGVKNLSEIRQLEIKHNNGSYLTDSSIILVERSLYT